MSDQRHILVGLSSLTIGEPAFNDDGRTVSLRNRPAAGAQDFFVELQLRGYITHCLHPTFKLQGYITAAAAWFDLYLFPRHVSFTHLILDHTHIVSAHAVPMVGNYEATLREIEQNPDGTHWSVRAQPRVE